MLSKKRRRIEPPTTHPRNKYSEKPPDFHLLASLYASFHPFVSYTSSGRPTMDWTDFNATRELTRILLLHDHACADITEVALEWSKKNVESNPHLSELIEIRCAANKIQCTEVVSCAFGKEIQQVSSREDEAASESFLGGENYKKENVLVGAVRDGEEFDFCMCNPPFFTRMEEAGLNPRPACGGSYEEMVYPSGELTFIIRIIEDSLELKQSLCRFTSMVGRKVNLKLLVSKFRESGVLIVKTTEFVQGQTARWGLAWSFVSPNKKSMLSHAPAQNNHSFTIEVTFPCERIDAILRNNGSGSSRVLHDDLEFRVSVFEQIPGIVLVKASSLVRGDPVSGAFSLLVRNLEEHLKNEFIKKAQQISKGQYVVG